MIKTKVKYSRGVASEVAKRLDIALSTATHRIKTFHLETIQLANQIEKEKIEKLQQAHNEYMNVQNLKKGINNVN